MNFQLKWELSQFAKELVWRVISFPTFFWVKVFFIFYKYLELGPNLKKADWLHSKFQDYQVLEHIWKIELWPLLKWLPVVVIFDVLVKRIFQDSIGLGNATQTRPQT